MAMRYWSGWLKTRLNISEIKRPASVGLYCDNGYLPNRQTVGDEAGVRLSAAPHGSRSQLS